MSSSPSAVARSTRVIRRPGSLLPVASVVTSRTALPGAAAAASATTLEEVLDAARAEAFEEGRLAGLEEAAAGVDARRSAAVATAAAELARTAGGLSALRAEVVDEVVADVIGLVFELLEVLVGRELALSRSPGRDAVLRALALVPDGHDLVIKVHPDCGLDERDIAELAGDPGVQVVRDPAVDPAGCEATIGACHVDAQISAALERVRRCLEGVRPVPSRVATA